MKRLAWFGLLLLALVACGKKDDSWLVKIKTQTLPVDAFSRRFKMTREYTQHPVITPEIIHQAIEKNMLNNLLFQAEGYALKLDKDSTVAAQIAMEERRMLTRNGGALFKAVVPASFAVTEQELRAGYEAGQQEVRLAHILVKSQGLADSIFQALNAGADFKALVTKYTMDVNTKGSGGEMNGWLNWTNMTPTYAAAVAKTPVGSYAQPVHTSYGYHVIRVDERRDRKQPPLEQVRGEIESNLKGLKQGMLIEDYTTGLAGKYGLKVDSLLALKILPALNSSNPAIKVDFTLISPEDQKKTLMSYDGGKWSVRETLDKYQQMTRGNAYRLGRYDDIVDFVQKASVQDLMMRDARERKLDQTDEHKKEFASARDQLLGMKCRERLVTQAVKVTDADIAAFYETHKEEYKDRQFSELQSALRGRVQNSKITELQDKVLAELRKKYPVKWNEQAIKKTAETLNAEKAAAPKQPAGAPQGMGQMPGQRPGQMPGPGAGRPQTRRPGQMPNKAPAPPQGVR